MTPPIFRPRQPAGRRPSAPSFARVLAASMVLFLYGVSFGSDGSVFAFTLVNRTAHYLHAVINDESHAYLPPGSSIQAELPAYGSVVANVRYSPGQGVRGEAARYFASECATTTSSSSSVSEDCNNSGSDCSETSSTSSHSSSSTRCQPIRWQVAAADLDSSAEGGAR